MFFTNNEAHKRAKQMIEDANLKSPPFEHMQWMECVSYLHIQIEQLKGRLDIKHHQVVELQKKVRHLENMQELNASILELQRHVAKREKESASLRCAVRNCEVHHYYTYRPLSRKQGIPLCKYHFDLYV